ncbi:MAG: sugar transferase [Bacteroidota bacterium]
MIRLSDIILGSVGLLISLPIFLIISIAIVVGSGLPVFYIQRRVGRFGKEFSLLKFRTMKVNAERSGQLTVGGKDSRITTIGYWLRRYKLDELPQLLHVISGSMSLVGPRPEVPKYVEFYSLEQRLVLGVRPGITDEASLVYFNENELLRMSTDPERHYIDTILPDKIRLNMPFVHQPTVGHYYKTIFKTIGRLFGEK